MANNLRHEQCSFSISSVVHSRLPICFQQGSSLQRSEKRRQSADFLPWIGLEGSCGPLSTWLPFKVKSSWLQCLRRHQPYTHMRIRQPGMASLKLNPFFVQEYGKDLFITCTTNNPVASGRSVRLSAENGCGALDNGVSKTNPLLILPLGTMYLVMKNADIFVEPKVLKCWVDAEYPDMSRLRSPCYP